MKATEILNSITDMLNLSTQVELDEMKLENGTVIEAEKFEAQQEVFIKTEDEKVPLPVGMYALEDGKQLVVVDEGIINEIKSQIEEGMAEEQVLEQDPQEKEEMGYATKEDICRAPAEAELSEVEVEAEELKEELSKPAAKPMKHSPEASTKKQSLYAQSRPMSTLDKVMSKISNIKN